MSSTARFDRGPGTGNHVTGRAAVESTTSYDSRSEEGRDKFRDTRDTTNSSREATRDTSYSRRDDDVLPRKEDMNVSRGADTSTESERHGNYDFRYPAYDEKMEWSCGETGGWQKLSFLFLVITFLCHSVAVCTPYWAVGYQGEQMTLYEGVWLSCYRERGVGSWVCSNYDTIRGLFEQPSWYEASQICAVLSVVLLLPAIVAATLYSYVVALSGRTRASWVLICFLTSSALCSFLSFVVFGAGYPTGQDFPPGNVYFHASFGLQIISFLLCCLSLGSHLKDSYSSLRIWDNNKADAITPSRNIATSAHGPYVTSSRVAEVKSGSRVPKLPSFSMPKFPSALSRFRSKGGSSSPSAPPLADSPDRVDVRDASVERVHPMPSATGGVPFSHPRGNVSTTYKSYAASSGGGSVGGYDSQV
ncbi:hypothetical protein ACOMHN_038741 [Nucella lapillus]